MNEKQLLEIEDKLERFGWKLTPELKWRDPVTGNDFNAETAEQIHEKRMADDGNA